MPLDGRDYGTLPLIAPIAAHPSAPAVGDALAGALAASYGHLRSNARLVGYTTFPVRIRTFFGFTIAPNTWATIAQHVVDLPYVATHLLAQLSVVCAPGTLFLRVTCFDGTNTDGDGVNDYSVETIEEDSNRPDTYFTNAHPDDPYFRRVVHAHALTDTLVSSGVASRTITVQAYATDTNGDPVTFAPQLVSVHWAAVG